LNNLINHKKILVFTNDAGASAYICSIILNESKFFNWIVYAIDNSPASKEFERNQISYTKFFLLDEINEIIKKKQPDVILYGTGWLNFSDIVKENAKKYDIKTVALVDHWVRYRFRFSNNALPDAILVMDDIANKIAIDTFNSEVTIFQIKNYYIENIRSHYALMKKEMRDYVVFISEPTKVVENDDLNFNVFEYTFLEDILKKFDKVIIRLHPTESKDKYDGVISKFPKVNVKVVEPYEENLATTLSKSKLTIGIGSTALYVSYLLGIKTISYIPNRYIEPSIPLPKKYILTNLEDLKTLQFSDSKRIDFDSRAIPFYEMINSFLTRTN